MTWRDTGLSVGFLGGGQHENSLGQVQSSSHSRQFSPSFPLEWTQAHDSTSTPSLQEPVALGPLRRSGSWGEDMGHTWPRPWVGLTGFWGASLLAGCLGTSLGADLLSPLHPLTPTPQPHRWCSGSRCRACRLRRAPQPACGVSCLSLALPWSGVRVAWSCRLTSAGSHSSGATWQSWCFGTCAGRTLENTPAPVAPRPPAPPSPSQVGPEASPTYCGGLSGPHLHPGGDMGSCVQRGADLA